MQAQLYIDCPLYTMSDRYHYGDQTWRRYTRRRRLEYSAFFNFKKVVIFKILHESKTKNTKVTLLKHKACLVIMPNLFCTLSTSSFYETTHYTKKTTIPTQNIPTLSLLIHPTTTTTCKITFINNIIMFEGRF